VLTAIEMAGIGLSEDLPLRVIRVNSEDEVIARANNLIVGRAAYETAVRLYPRDVSGIGMGRGSLPGATRRRHELCMSAS
jgi:hypothetical protein